MVSAALPQFNPARIRSYLLRLPIFTRVALFAIIALWFLSILPLWDVQQWGALIPNEIHLSTMHRLNTYPLVHLNFFHVLFNALALTPLLERFEAEHGTLVTLAMFLGPLSTFPAGLYLLIERVILRGNNAVEGASVWVFVLLAAEAIKTYKTNPHFSIGPYKIPTWSTPLILTLVINFLVPSSSFLGHICAIAVGYLFGFGYLKVFAPPEKALRWIEGKLDLLGRLPHYVSVDQKTYGRYGVLPSSTPTLAGAADGQVPMTYQGSTQRLGP
ncbi:hypothetical protein L228DRAFT_247412 [Xylona heveae TC161]|uniref:rhomboid protease n=1 Tax=Xylona heveae (strain CBS 132557 / TC161) TaxID=1328760 RepID=A0A165H4N7_XYLHT|nr:hypothetical protein L228DRAFT_247412 [Xylona heveae TC161]KZF22980.1 hypothetical protein L228DRAFT_247412 [Xylona heveae TC161]